MKTSFLTSARRIKRIMVPGLFAVFASSGAASAAEERNWFQSLLDRSDAIAEEGQDNVTPSHVFRATRDLISEIRILRDETRRLRLPC